jgi:hypothetical protein
MTALVFFLAPAPARFVASRSLDTLHRLLRRVVMNVIVPMVAVGTVDMRFLGRGAHPSCIARKPVKVRSPGVNS